MGNTTMQGPRGIGDSLADNIANGLARARWLQVVSRAAASGPTGPASLRRICAELGVDYIVTGSLQSHDGSIRLHVQLQEAARGVQLWSHRYDRSAGDLFALQDEITEHVVAAIEPAIYAQDVFDAERRPDEGAPLWRKTVRAVSLIHCFERQPNEQARALLGEVLVADPRQARAQAILAWALYWAHQCQWVDARAEALGAAQDLARRASCRDQSEPWARMVLGFLHSQRREHRAGLDELRAALRFNPNFALGRMLLGWALVRAGQFEDAAAETAKALRLSPADNFISVYQATHGLALLALRRFEDALPFLTESVAPHAEYMGHCNTLISCYGHLGRRKDADRLLAYRMRQLRKPLYVADAARALAGFAHADTFTEGLRAAGVQDRAPLRPRR
jgi:adenylate cyclase